MAGSTRDLKAQRDSMQKALDTGKGTITLTIGAKNGVGGEDKDFKLAKDTVATESSGAPLKLADLKVDTEVILRLSLDQKAKTWSPLMSVNRRRSEPSSADSQTSAVPVRVEMNATSCPSGEGRPP